MTMEENVLQGGYGLAVTAYIHEHYPQVRVLNIALPRKCLCGARKCLCSAEGLGIDSDSIIRTMKEGGWIEI